MSYFNYGNSGNANMTGGMSPVNPLAGTQLENVFRGQNNNPVAQSGLGQGIESNPWSNFASVMQGIGSGVQAFTGMKQLGMAKKQFQWGKDVFNTNLFNQATTVNSQLADRQERRQYFNSDAMAPDAYLAKHGVASSMGEAKGRQKQQENAWTQSQAISKAAKGGA